MSDRASISIDDLPPEVRKLLAAKGVRKPRTQSMSINEVRTAAIRILAVVADLTPNERKRVIAHAAKLNEV